LSASVSFLSILSIVQARSDCGAGPAYPATAVRGVSMIPWVHLDTAAVPGGDALKLMRRGNEFSILAGSVTLMNSRMSGSETVLAALACDRLRDRPNCSMLI